MIMCVQGEILDNQPVAHWTFNEGQGSVVSNSIGNQLNGQISGASWSEGAEIFINNIPIISDQFLQNNEESCLLYTSPSPRDQRGSRMPSCA